MNIPVYVCTSDKYLWALKPFAYLFTTFWSGLQPVTVIGYKEPDFSLPANFSFYSAGKDEGMDRWSDGVIKFLQEEAEDIFVLLLEDYWLTRKADNEGVNSLADYVAHRPDIVRLDLSTDRLHNGYMIDTGEAWGHYDIIETPAESEYQMSLQAAIWRRDLLLELLKPGKSAWQVEVHTSPPATMRVVGTYQHPVKYANVFKGGDPKKLLNLGQIPTEHVDVMRERGWIE